MGTLILLLPERARLRDMPMDARVRKALGQADADIVTTGHDAQLARHFDVIPRGLPAAALIRNTEPVQTDVARSAWLRADPAYLRPDINGVRLLGTGECLGIDETDAQALLPALRPMFGDAGFELDAPHPARWYVRLPRESKLPVFASPDAAMGEDIFEHMPDGDLARRWRSLANEVQVILHQHPHNAVRAAQNKVPINALWFWGGGVLPDHVRADFPSLRSDDPLLQGLAKLANLSVTRWADADVQSDMGEGLIDLRDPRDAVRVCGAMLPVLIDRVRRSRLQMLALDFADGHVLRLQAKQRWRFWRKPLASLA